ncbi:MAG TPA: helix-hairpin-helix domain-containing protein, partial [Limnochordia bacterium]|nr:helix-hairpin-helix domain-containing protein [Limnochordia bacterium]
IQQGVGWTRSNQDGGRDVAVVQAAETGTQEPGNSHCPLIHINSAGMAELQGLPGVGPVYAERIIVERRENPFEEKHDLLRIAGIGEKRLAQMAHLICLYYDDYASDQ